MLLNLPLKTESKINMFAWSWAGFYIYDDGYANYRYRLEEAKDLKKVYELIDESIPNFKKISDNSPEYYE